jgi:hypothetical protein
MVDPRCVHLIAVKHVMRYLKGTMDYRIEYVADSEIGLLGYSDSDWDGSVANWKSTLGCCFTFESSMISWISKKKSCVELNMDEAKYVAASAEGHEVVWLQKLLTRLFNILMEAICILCDNKSCIKLLENPVFHDRSKHIEISYHYIRDMVQKEAVRIQYVATDEHIADVLTKLLSRTKFEYFMEMLGVVPLERE